MSGQNAAAVFHSDAPLNSRFGEIADLSSNICYEGKEAGCKQRRPSDGERKVDQSEEHARHSRRYSAFPTLAWTNGGREFAATEVFADVISARVADPVHH